jgi:predicted PurR-regulated permease PerM
VAKHIKNHSEDKTSSENKLPETSKALVVSPKHDIKPPEPVVNNNKKETKESLWDDRIGKASIRSIQVLTILIILSICAFAFAYMKIVFIPALVALILASAATPLMDKMIRHKIPRPLAAVITMVSSLTILGAIITSIVFAVRNEWGNLSHSVVKAFEQIRSYLNSSNLPIDQKKIDGIFNDLNNFLTSAEFGKGALTSLGTFAEFLTGIILMLVILFFFLKDGPQIWNFCISFFKPDTKARAIRSGSKAVGVMGGYLSGTASVALIDAAAIGIVLFALQVPLALPLAVLVFLGAFIPIVGATLTGIVASLVALVTNDLTTAVIVAIAVIAVQQLEGNLLAPYLLGNALKIHALVVLIALPIGTILGGILGTLLAAPLTAVVWAIVSTWNQSLVEEEDLTP